MAATIKTTLTDNSKEWVAELKARFLAAGGSAEGFEAHLESLNKELDSRQAAKATQQIKKLADEFDNATGSANKMGKALGGISAAGVTAVSTAVGATVVGLKAMVEGGRKAYQAISMLAETAPAFAKLKESIDGVGSSLTKAAQSFTATNFGAGVIAGATAKLSEMGKGLEALPTLWQDVRTIAHSTMAEIGEGLGIEQTERRRLITTIQEENTAIEAKILALKKEAAVVSSGKNLQMVNEAIRKADHEAAMQAWVENLDTHAKINNAIREEEKAAAAKAKAGEFNEEAARASLAKTAALKARLQKLDADWDAKQKADDAELKAKGEAKAAEKVAQAKKANDEIVAAEKAHLASMQSAHEEFHKKKFEAAQAAKAAEIQLEVNAAKAKADLLAKRAEQHQGNAAFLVGGQDPRAVAKQVADNRKKQAMDAYGKANSKDYMKFKNASNSIKGELKNIDRPDSAKGQKERKRLLEAKRFNDRKAAAFVKEQKQVGMKARGQGFRDAVRGNVGSDEVVGAQQDLANKVINQGESTGKLNQSQAQVLRAATGVLQKQQAEQRAIADDLENTKQTLRSMMLGGGKSPRQAGR